jgi:hypothetical protein
MHPNKHNRHREVNRNLEKKTAVIVDIDLLTDLKESPWGENDSLSALYEEFTKGSVREYTFFRYISRNSDMPANPHKLKKKILSHLTLQFICRSLKKILSSNTPGNEESRVLVIAGNADPVIAEILDKAIKSEYCRSVKIDYFFLSCEMNALSGSEEFIREMNLQLRKKGCEEVYFFNGSDEKWVEGPI